MDKKRIIEHCVIRRKGTSPHGLFMYFNWTNNISVLYHLYLEPLFQKDLKPSSLQFCVKNFFGQNGHRWKRAMCWCWDFFVWLWMEVSTHLHAALHQYSVRSRGQQTSSESFQTRHANWYAEWYFTSESSTIGKIVCQCSDWPNRKKRLQKKEKR